LLPSLIGEVPYLDIFEERVEVLLPEELGIRIPLVGYLDTTDGNLSVFGEYKTGKHFWDEQSVEDSEQLLFYATLIWLKTNEIPHCFLTWVQTEESDSGEIYYTGNVSTFSRNFTDRQLKIMLRKIVDTIQEIDAYQYSEIEISDKLTDKLLKLKGKRDKLNSRIKLIENEIKNTLEFKGEKYGVSTVGDYTLVQTKKYAYSNQVSDMEKEIKRLKKEERDNGEVEVQLSPSSLRFSENKLNN